jgi:hypothetical protein
MVIGTRAEAVAYQRARGVVKNAAGCPGRPRFRWPANMETRPKPRPTLPHHDTESYNPVLDGRLRGVIPLRPPWIVRSHW